MMGRTLGNLGRIGLLAGVLTTAGGGFWLLAQEPTFRSSVDLVVLSFTVTDSKGKYVNGLKPNELRILEDGIRQKIATFSEGNRPAMQIQDDGTLKPLLPGDPESARLAGGGGDSRGTDAFVGTNVFVLFDTSNFMYRG